MASVVDQTKKLTITRRSSLLRRLLATRELGPLGVLIILLIGFDWANPAFLSAMNITNVLGYVAELGIVALGMTMLMTAGEFDLTVGAVFGFTPCLLFLLYKLQIMGFAAAFAASMTVALLIGLVNGILVTKVGISSLITTIAMQMVIRGVTLYMTNGFASTTWEVESSLKRILIGSVVRIEGSPLLASLFWLLGFAALLYFILNYTRFGNWATATGGNINSARARGVNTDRVKIILFAACALLSAFAGITDSLRVRTAYPTAGTGMELEVIAMVVIGGTALAGGRGTIIGTLIGVLILRGIQNGIIIVGVPGLAYNIFVGGIVVIMMGIYAVFGKKQAGET
jgi:simple sugar transport system permease protein